MVYIVSSNISGLGEGVSLEGINNPARYSNTLSSTFNIEPNSEIAVESIKINRNGNVQLSSANNQFNVYIGHDLNASDLTLEQSGGFPVSTWIRGSSGGKTMTLSPSDLREKISYGLQAGLDQHPNYSATWNGSNTDYPDIDLLNGSGIFTGYQYLFNQNGCKSVSTRTGMTTETGQKGWVSSDVRESAFAVSSAGASGVFVKKPSAGVPSGDECSVIYQALPMSLASGSAVFYYNSGANGSAGDSWEVGLTRATFNFDQLGRKALHGAYTGIPEYYRDYYDGMHGGYDDIDFFDYSVKLEAGDLYVYQSVGFGDDGPRYRLPGSQTSASYIGVKFHAKGTEMEISGIDASGAEDVFFDSTSSNKLDNTKPIGITTQHLFPKVNIFSTASASRLMTTQYDGVNMKTTNFLTDISTSYVYGGRLHSPNTETDAIALSGSLITGKLTYQDWYSWCWQTGRQGLAMTVDHGPMYDYRTNPLSPSNPLTPDYRVRGLNASGGIDLYTVIIMSKDEKYNGASDHTDQASAQNIMGFEMSPTQTLKSQYTSASGSEVFMNSVSVPKMVSNQSLFVRLPNLPIETYNTGKGSLSKILYHLPRFDNSGAEVGGLFFQPADRIYIPLENTSSFRVNNLQVEICNSDETVDQVDLVGQTVICFDIRKIR